jgi:hypothetical protein
MTDVQIEVVRYVGMFLSLALGMIGVWAARRNYKMDMADIRKAENDDA